LFHSGCVKILIPGKPAVIGFLFLTSFCPFLIPQNTVGPIPLCMNANRTVVLRAKCKNVEQVGAV
jgi:hypothetical protein